MPAQENEKVIQQTQHRHHNLDDVNGSRHELCFVVVGGWLVGRVYAVDVAASM